MERDLILDSYIMNLRKLYLCNYIIINYILMQKDMLKKFMFNFD